MADSRRRLVMSIFSWLRLGVVTLALVTLPVAAQDHTVPGHPAPTAEASDHGAEHAAAGHEEAEPASELAVEHGSWFKPLSDAINRAVGRPVISGYTLVAWLLIALLVWFSRRATALIRENPAAAMQPRGLQNFFEYVVEGLGNFVEGLIGPHGRKYTPLIGTFFLFILVSNWVAVIPGFVAPTSTLNMTVALGLTAFCFVQYFAVKENGLKRYLLHFAGNPDGPIAWCLSPLLFVLELIGECVKPLSLSMRLFGNIFGEDMVVIQVALFTLGLGGWKIAHHHLEASGSLWVGLVPVHLPFIAFSVFGGLIQALVFSMLTSIYIALLTAHHEEHHEHSHENNHSAG